MTCAECGSDRVVWMGPLTNLTHTECPDCGAQNCQEPEDGIDQMAEDEQMLWERDRG